MEEKKVLKGLYGCTGIVMRNSTYGAPWDDYKINIPFKLLDNEYLVTFDPFKEKIFQGSLTVFSGTEVEITRCDIVMEASSIDGYETLIAYHDMNVNWMFKVEIKGLEDQGHYYVVSSMKNPPIKEGDTMVAKTIFNNFIFPKKLN